MEKLRDVIYGWSRRMFDVTTQQSDVEEDDLIGGHWDGWYTPDNAGQLNKG